MAENLAESGDERERRMAEGTRRLVYLAVRQAIKKHNLIIDNNYFYIFCREAKLSRRVEIGQRVRRTMAEGCEWGREYLINPDNLIPLKNWTG
jgi:hypothetical protein